MAAVKDHTYGHLLQMGRKLVIPVHVKAVGVLHLLWEIIIIVNQDIKARNPLGILYTSDPLWDGAGCESEGSCCSTAPWFTVDLVNPTTDDIEVRICSDYREDEEDTPIHLLELYIQ